MIKRLVIGFVLMFYFSVAVLNFIYSDEYENPYKTVIYVIGANTEATVYTLNDSDNPDYLVVTRDGKTIGELDLKDTVKEDQEETVTE